MQVGTPEIVSAAAAVVSAVGGAFAALAAFHSAESARVAQQAAAAAEHRAALRQIGTTATEVLIEVERIASRGNDLTVSSGGEAKSVIAEGQVRVNGKVETQKRKQIVSGDVIAFGTEKIVIQLKLD